MKNLINALLRAYVSELKARRVSPETQKVARRRARRVLDVFSQQWEVEVFLDGERPGTVDRQWITLLPQDVEYIHLIGGWKPEHWASQVSHWEICGRDSGEAFPDIPDPSGWSQYLRKVVE